jgi:SMC interacting uncharacterized protein involved in chromosome segregation
VNASELAVPCVLLVMSVAIGAMGWFLKGLREELSQLTIKVASERERNASRTELDEVKAKVDALQVELHTKYVREEDFLRFTLESRIALDDIKKHVGEMNATVRLAMSFVEQQQNARRGANGGT